MSMTCSLPDMVGIVYRGVGRGHEQEGAGGIARRAHRPYPPRERRAPSEATHERIR